MSRVQMVLRPWTTGKNTQYEWGATDNLPAETSIIIATGLLESPKGTLGDDVMLTMFHDAPTDRMVFGTPVAIDDPHAVEDCAVSSLGRWISRSVWQGLQIPSLPLSIAGQVVARRSAMQTSEGHETHLVIGLLTSGPGIPIRRPAILEGTGGRDLRFLVSASDRPLLVPEAGNTADHIFQLPNWGWQADGLAFRSTLRPEIMEAMDRINVLRTMADPGSERLAELKQLQVFTGGLGTSDDAEFMRFLKLQAATWGPNLPVSQPVDARWIDMRKKITDLVVTVMLSQPDDAQALLEIGELMATAGLPMPYQQAPQTDAPRFPGM